MLERDLKTWLLETSSDVYVPSPLPGIAKAFSKSAMLQVQEKQNLPRQEWKGRDPNSRPVTATYFLCD